MEMSEDGLLLEPEDNKGTLRNSCNSCISCGSLEVGVISTFQSREGRVRIRKCGECGNKWRTLESFQHYADTYRDKRPRKTPPVEFGKHVRQSKYRLRDIPTSPLWEDK